MIPSKNESEQQYSIKFFILKDKCNGKNKHDSCSPSNAPANSGWCIDNTTDASVRYSCAAKECNSGYLLYTTKIAKRQEIEVVGENGKKVGEHIEYAYTGCTH